jgi:hypothetical protein
MRSIFVAAALAVSLPLSGVGAQAPAAAAPTFDPKAVLAMEAGTWDADITFPSAEAGKQKAKGVQVNRLRSGGMWIINEFSVDGTPYEGTGVWGFDRSTGRFAGIWTDTNDQKIRMDDGRWDPATSTMTWSADVAQPDGRHARYLFTEEFKGDTRLFNMVALTRKGEVPLVSMVFTRRKS